MLRRILKVALVIVVVLVVAIILAAQLDLSALPEPGARETSLATSAKRWLIGRAARRSVTAVPAEDASSADNGSMTYGMDCDTCHGKDGRHPTENGRWMYPRVPDLGRRECRNGRTRNYFGLLRMELNFPGCRDLQRCKRIKRFGIWCIMSGRWERRVESSTGVAAGMLRARSGHGL